MIGSVATETDTICDFIGPLYRGVSVANNRQTESDIDWIEAFNVRSVGMAESCFLLDTVDTES